MNRIYTKLPILLLIVFLLPLSMKAQSNQDTELWSSIALRYKVNKKWRVNGQFQFRLKDNISVKDQDFVEVELMRKFKYGFSGTVGFRNIWKNDTDGQRQGVRNFYRVQADLGYKRDINRFGFASRMRYQYKQEYDSHEAGRAFLRLKLGGEYNIRKWKLDPEFSAEIFQQLGNFNKITKLRYTLGTSYGLKKYGDISGFFRIEDGIDPADPFLYKIIGLRYRYTF